MLILDPRPTLLARDQLTHPLHFLHLRAVCCRCNRSRTHAPFFLAFYVVGRYVADVTSSLIALSRLNSTMVLVNTLVHADRMQFYPHGCQRMRELLPSSSPLCKSPESSQAAVVLCVDPHTFSFVHRSPGPSPTPNIDQHSDWPSDAQPDLPSPSGRLIPISRLSPTNSQIILI
jgi:hypothetical protein